VPPWPRLTAAPDSFFKRLWGFDVGFGWHHAHLPGLPTEGFQKLPHLGRLAGNPGEGFDPRRRCCHRRGRSLPKLDVERRTVLVEGTAWLTRLKVFQLVKTARGIRLERAMEARFRNATEPRELARGKSLAASVESFHTPLDARIGMLKTPILQCRNVCFAKRDLHHGRAPPVCGATHLTPATRP
jgi:hypothetical protein